MKTTYTWFFFVIITIFLTFLGPWKFLTGERIYCADSLVGIANIHLFYDSIFNGFLPLWTPEMNGGQPLWTQVETVPSFDPIALICWYFTHLFHLKSTISYQVTCTVWLLTFSLGGMLCSRYIYKNWWINFTSFIILYSGPLGLSIIAQSYGFLIPFRYTPFVILFFIRYCIKTTIRNALSFGAITGLSFAGYQTPYSLMFVFMFCASYIFYNYIKDRRLITRLVNIKINIYILLIILPITLPTVFACYKMTKLFAVGRAYYPFGYLFPTKEFFDSLFSPLIGITHAITQQHTGNNASSYTNDLMLSVTPHFRVLHGSTYIGIIPIIACVSIPLITIINFIKTKKTSIANNFDAIEYTWFTVILFASILCLDCGILSSNKNQTFLGLRNWGFLLTMVLFSLSQLTVIGIKHLYIFIINTSDTLSKNNKSRLRTISTCSYFIFVFSVINFTIFNIVTPLEYISSNDKLDGFPEAGSKRASLPHYKQWEFNILTYAPFFTEGPSIIHEQFAFMNQYVDEKKIPFPVPSISHQFRLPRYQKLIETTENIDKLKSVLGVTTPILNFVSADRSFSKTHKNSLNLLKQAHDAKTLNESSFFKEIKPNEISLPSDIDHNNFSTSNIIYSINVSEYTPNKLSLKLTSNTDGVLVYADNYDDYWEAWLDNSKTDILIANTTNKAVFIPQGDHNVEFIYKPKLYIISFWIRALTITSLFCYLLISAYLTLRNPNKHHYVS